MTEIIVTEKDGVLLVDSRLIAFRIGIEHESFMRTVAKYQSQTEQAFGGLRFEIGVPDQPSGNPPRFIFLTEDGWLVDDLVFNPHPQLDQPANFYRQFPFDFTQNFSLANLSQPLFCLFMGCSSNFDRPS